MEAHTLSEEEFLQRYPTEVERHTFQKRHAEMVQTFSTERREFFSRFSELEYENLLSAMHEQLTKEWGAAAADKRIALLRIDVGR